MIDETAITVRPLLQTDSAFLCSIFQDNAEYYEIFFDSETSLSEWNNRVLHFLNQSVVHHFIIETNGAAVGWISFADTQQGDRELCIFVITKEHLRCGYGSQSLSWLIEKSREENIQNLLLNVNQSNSRAIQFYQKFGFEIYAEEIIPECNDAVNLPQYKMRLSLT